MGLSKFQTTQGGHSEHGGLGGTRSANQGNSKPPSHCCRRLGCGLKKESSESLNSQGKKPFKIRLPTISCNPRAAVYIALAVRHTRLLGTGWGRKKGKERKIAIENAIQRDAAYEAQENRKDGLELVLSLRLGLRSFLIMCTPRVRLFRALSPVFCDLFN